MKVWLLVSAAIWLSGCASKPSGRPMTEQEVQQRRVTGSAEFSTTYMPHDGKDCWKLNGEFNMGPAGEELELLRDPNVADEKPEVKSWIAPDLAKAGVPYIDGMVYVQVLVAPSGQVVEACLESTTDDRLVRPSLAAAFATVFHPGRSGGVPVSVWVMLPYKYTS